jgi:hypothetical protein
MILNQEIVTDQADPRMFEFRRSRGEFEPKAIRKTIRLEITHDEPEPGNGAVNMAVGFYEGESPTGFHEFYSRILRKPLP